MHGRRSWVYDQDASIQDVLHVGKHGIGYVGSMLVQWARPVLLMQLALPLTPGAEERCLSRYGGLAVHHPADQWLVRTLDYLLSCPGPSQVDTM
jgi:hypothetical protein